MIRFLLKLFTWSSLVVTKYPVAKKLPANVSGTPFRDPATAVVWLDSQQGYEANFMKVMNNKRAIDYWSHFSAS
tara:strand:+ start:42 stop:263 length:222 start_codon:yes stop_codon:yes gene_type:complete